MRLKLRESVLKLFSLIMTTFAHGVVLYEIHSPETGATDQFFGSTRVAVSKRDVRLDARFTHVPHFIDQSSLDAGFRLYEHFQYQDKSITLKAKITTDMGEKIPGRYNDISAVFQAITISEPNDDGAQANPFNQFYFQVTVNQGSSPIRKLFPEYKSMSSFPFKPSVYHFWPVSEKVFTSMLMLLYNDSQANTGSNTELFYDTITIRRKYSDGRVQTLDLYSYGKKYLVLSDRNQYWLTTWVIPNVQFGVPEGTVAAFEYQRIGDPAIRHSLLLKVSDEDEQCERESRQNQVVNSQREFKKTHRRANSNTLFKISEIQYHLRSHSLDYHISPHYQHDPDYTVFLRNMLHKMNLKSRSYYLP